MEKKERRDERAEECEAAKEESEKICWVRGGKPLDTEDLMKLQKAGKL